jgi:uncharacterized protein YbaR (Trm112 family)
VRELRPEFLEIVRCPVPECRGRLRVEGEQLVCLQCGRRYRIEESWPVLIPEEAVADKLAEA